MAPIDPDELALQIVQQYLTEHGYSSALRALEADSGRRCIAGTAAVQSSQLLQWCYRHVEEQAAAAEDEDEDSDEADAAAQRRAEENLLRTAPPDYPAVLASAVDDLHPANICAVACWPGATQLVSGSADGVVRTFSPGGDLLASGTVEGYSGVLCLSLLQQQNEEECGAGVIAAGCMDGSVCLLDAETNSVLCTARPHRKYCVAARWAGGGRYLVTGAWDHSFAVLRVNRGAEDGGAWSLAAVHTEACAGQVQDICVLPSAGGGADSFLVAVRGSNYLQEYSTQEEAPPGGSGTALGEPGTGGGATVGLRARHNLNPAAWDNHVSFTAMSLALSPCGMLLLVSADSGRLMVYRRGRTAFHQARLLLLPMDPFHHHCCVWHRSGCYVLAAAAGGVVSVFEVATSRVVAQVKAHEKAVRALGYDPQSNRLVTCSFDRTVKVWAAAETAMGAAGVAGRAVAGCTFKI